MLQFLKLGTCRNNKRREKIVGGVFGKCHSTSHAVITLVEKITHALDRGKIVGGVFIDFKKAYDTLSHDILLQKLEAYGIKNNIYSDGKSDIKDVLHGVSQDSILCPPFYIIYANDFSKLPVYYLQQCLQMTLVCSLKASYMKMYIKL